MLLVYTYTYIHTYNYMPSVPSLPLPLPPSLHWCRGHSCLGWCGQLEPVLVLMAERPSTFSSERSPPGPCSLKPSTCTFVYIHVHTITDIRMVCIRIYIIICIYIHTCIYICIHKCIHNKLYTYMYYAHIHMYIHIIICMYITLI